MKSRNNLVEFARFLFSMLVVGYHIQMTFLGGGTHFFANGALAVEFFFLISGYFLARSIEKINAKENANIAFESLRFMGNKTKSILPIHVTAIVAVVIVTLACNLSGSGQIILKGLPSIFLVQDAGIWTEAYADALIVPEWYLSSMLLCMLIMVPIALLLRKRMKGVFVILLLLGVLGVIAVIVGLCMNWAFTTTFVYDLRAWGELCVGMFAYYLANAVAKREWKKGAVVTLKVLEIVGYCVPIVLGFIPMRANLQPACMAITVVCVFMALTITFAGKGTHIANEKLNKTFGYLGGLSLPIYLIHPVIIILIEYVGKGLHIWAVYLIVFAGTGVAAVIYNFAQKGIKNLMVMAKQRGQEFSN